MDSAAGAGPSIPNGGEMTESQEIATTGAVPDPEAVRTLLQREASSAGAGAFAALVSNPEADFQRSADVLKKDDKATLEGIPFAIVSIRFSVSEKGKFAEGIERDKVSLELITVDDRKLIINDGSTGIRRQIVQKLQEKGWINVGDAHKAVPDGNPFDKPVQLWLAGEDQAKAGFDLSAGAWVYPRGLRGSDYDHPEFGEATTYYLA